MSLTKQDLESIKGIISTELKPIERKVDSIDTKLITVEHEIKEFRKDLSGLREQIQELSVTLDKFVKMMTDYGEEFKLLKGEVDQIKDILLQKFGIKIAVQGVSAKK